MNQRKAEGIIFFLIIVGMLLSMFFVLFAVTCMFVAASIMASLPYLMNDPKYQFAKSLREYDLECAILSALRSARIITGCKDWLTLAQIVKEAEDRLGERWIYMDCTLILNSLIARKIVGTGEQDDKAVYILVDGSYRPEMPERIEEPEKTPLAA